MTAFTALVTKMKEEDSLTLTGPAIKEYRFLEQLLVAFKTEFDNSNYELANKYSNYRQWYSFYFTPY